MAVSQLMREGLDLLIVGMGTVFMFLALLVVMVSLMSRLAQRIEAMLPKEEEAAPAKHIAAISAAVHRYRASRTS